MDTYITVKLVTSQGKAKAVFNQIETEATRLQKLLSAYETGSEVYRINHRPRAWRAMRIHPEVARLISLSLEMAKQTNGYFDITIAPVKWLWGFGTGLTNRVPGKSEIDSVLQFVGYNKIAVDTVSNRLIFNDPRVQIDLGGVSKGYALSRFERIAMEAGISNFLLDGGGDILVHGRKPGGGKWVVGLRHPRKDGLVAQFDLADSAAVATSGDYERFFFHNGKRYHHLFNPFTGYPADSSISVTLVRRDPVEANAPSAGVFAMGPTKGLAFLNGNRIAGVIIYEANGERRCLVSNELRGLKIQD